MSRPDRVVIIGTGLVGATTAYALLTAGVASELVLVDRDRHHAEGHVQELRDAALFSRTTRLVSGDFADCHDASVIVITAGVHQTASMTSRLDDLTESAPIVHQIVSQVADARPTGVVVRN